ncbi:MAG: NAD(P)-binding domain-containing protein [Devosia sp.]
MRLGFIGTGTISEALVIGLSTAPGAPTIKVSPRTEAISRRLADRFANVTRADSNQAVIDASDIVMLAMRPAQVEEVLGELRFDKGQTVISLVASLGLSALAALVPNVRLFRFTPLPMVAERRGPMLLFPHDVEMSALLSPLGTLIVPQSEAEFRELGGPSGFMSSYFALQQALIAGLVDKGIGAGTARLYVRSLMAALGETGLAEGGQEGSKLVSEHETPGGINFNTRRVLGAAGWFDKPSSVFAEVAAIPRNKLT